MFCVIISIYAEFLLHFVQVLYSKLIASILNGKVNLPQLLCDMTCTPPLVENGILSSNVHLTFAQITSKTLHFFGFNVLRTIFLNLTFSTLLLITSIPFSIIGTSPEFRLRSFPPDTFTLFFMPHFMYPKKLYSN